jgi:hypothetical protein
VCLPLCEYNDNNPSPPLPPPPPSSPMPTLSPSLQVKHSLQTVEDSEGGGGPSPATVASSSPSATPDPAEGTYPEDDREASYTPPSLCSEETASVGTVERLGGGSAVSTCCSEPEGAADTSPGGEPEPAPVRVTSATISSPRKLQPRAALPPRKADPGAANARPRPAMRGRAVTKPGAAGATPVG